MALAKVDGILSKNNEVRNEMLKRVYWKDKQYTYFSQGDFVHDISVTTNSVSPKGNGKDLLNYTHDGSTEYSHEILKRYMSNGVNHPIYEIEPVSDGKRFKWEGNYQENFEPYNTRYKISEIKLIEGERQIDFSNEGRFLEEKYLTPKLLDFYGSKTAAQISIAQNSVLGKMDGFIRIGTGRMADIAEASVKFVHDYEEILKRPDNFKGAGFKYLQEQLNNSNKKRYVEFISFDSDSLQDEDALNYYPNASKERGIIDNYDKDFSQKTFLKNNVGEFYTVYDEKDIRNNDNSSHSVGEGLNSNREVFATPSLKEKSLLSKTVKMFNEHKIATMIGRFHTTLSDEGVDSYSTAIDSAVRKGIGNSKGRNLLKKDTTVNNDGPYDNPYCRVWTYHHQYDKVSKLIRPFGDGNELRSYNPYSTKYINSDGSVDGSLDGNEYLKQNTVLGENGFVNIAPKKNSENSASSVEIKKCMFSIENLAWKDVPRKGGIGDEQYYISDEQRGPNGGRIMWFPPYDLNFQESVNVNWNQNNFIGRGEPVYTYSNTVRNGVLSFVILVDHPSIIDNIPKNNIKESELSDEDILRYFAGCDIPDGFNSKSASKEDTDISQNKNDSDEPNAVSNKEKAQYIKFNVYFPNNYSGNGAFIDKNEWETNGNSDLDWYDYILFGKNVLIPTDILNIGNGYEINDNGITDNPTDDVIKVNLKTQPWQKGIGIVTGVDYTYRVDYDLAQNLENKDLNGNSRGMNPDKSNYYDNKGYSLNSNTSKQGDAKATHSFVDILYALVTAKENSFSGFLKNNIGTITSGSTDYEKLKDLFTHSERISKVKITGMATLQDSKNSNLLAKRRAKSISNIIKNFVSNDKIEITTGNVPELVNNTDINTLEAKKQRCASCEIWFNMPEISTVNGTHSKTNEEIPQTEKTIHTIESVNEPMRYETESEYFKNIEKEDPLIHKKILEKFKYFNPAFHSISPEGFNARLTFLQQCSRQGHTIEATDENGFAKTAGNLAFGRMPVCVLRLGDFINTKMIINGMSFNYDAQGPMQWDLNPEGIGVQPMYAKINLQVTILGGQSLEGPISRLQNAVSFNYYANTGVYDNRADRIQLEKQDVTPEIVRIEKTKEESVDKYIDESEYTRSKLTYRHVFTPYPKITKINQKQ